MLYFICKQTAWNCSLLLNWCEAPCRIPAFLPSVCQMVSPQGQAGWLEPAKSHPRARAGGSTGKDIFWRVPRAARVLFRGSSFNIQNVVLQVFQQIHNAEKSLGWSQINIWRCLYTAGDQFLLLSILALSALLKAFMSMTSLFFFFCWLTWLKSLFFD